MINIIKDGIISYIKEEVRFFENYNFIDNYFDNSDVQNLFKSFIFDQMVFSHYSIARNGKEVLVSYNTNIDNITEEEIKEYIDSNATLKKYLKDLLYKFYFEHIDVPCITEHSIQNAIKLKKEFEEDGENFDKWDATSVVQNIIDSIYCPSIYFEDVLYDNDLYSFLQQEFNNSDIMQEIKVTPPQNLTSFPVKITRETYDNIAKILSKQGYTYSRNIPLESINPWVEREKVDWLIPTDVLYLVLDPHSNSHEKVVKISATPRKSDTLPGVELEEIKVNKPTSDMLPLVDCDGDDCSMNYENIIKNLKNFKPRIANMLNLPWNSLELNEFLANYVNQGLENMEYIGESDLYKDMSLDEWLEDIKTTYDSSRDEFERYEEDDEHNVISIQDLQEIKVNTPYSFGDNPKTLNGVAKVETDFFGKGYALALVDLGSHYTFVPYGDQPFVILIPKQYIEPTDKEYYPISSDGVQQLKDLLRQGKIEKVKAVNNIDEIKVLAPNPFKFPLKVTHNDYDTIARRLTKAGYRWVTGEPIESINHWIEDPDDPNKQYYLRTDQVGYLIVSALNPKVLQLVPNPNEQRIAHLKDMETRRLNRLNKNALSEEILKEYPESKINSIITRWGIDPEKDRTRANVARQIITRFDQIKGELDKKLDILVIPDAIRSKDIKNIDLYSFEDLQNLVNSYPESEEKKKKEAINHFVKQGIDKSAAQSYVARFNSTNRDKLKFGAREGIADLGFTVEQILDLIPKRLQQKELFLDPRNWRWEAFEQMMDAVFPSQKKAEDGGENLAETNADKVYDKDGIEIYKGDDREKCVSYNPVTPSGRKKYGWCVTQVGNANYDFYRFGEKKPTFYFIFDRSKDSSPEHAPFQDQWHAFVIQVNSDGESYVVTGADNRRDIHVKSWDEISTIVPPDTWAKIKNLKQYFKPIGLSAVERGRLYASDKSLNLEEFKAIPQDEKILYVQGKASKNSLPKDILEILPKYKINYEGRSTTLANIAIDSGQSMPYSVLKDYESLAKRYAIFRARHDAYGQKPIPLPFVKYLDEPAKEKYLKTFDDSLTFEYIEKYFGDSVASNYVNNEVKDLKFIPASAVKYIQNPKIKQLYEVYSKLIEPWQYGKFTNISDEELAGLTTMPGQDVTPRPIDLNQWKQLSNSEKKAVIDIAEKFSGNPKYGDFLYALPIIIKDSNETYVLLPKKGDVDDGYYELWMLVDERGNIIKDNIPNESTLADRSLYNWGPDEEAGYKRVYNIKDLKIA
jgi:hypothetical protein